MTHTWVRSDWKKTTRLLPLCWSLSRTTTTQFDSIYLKLSPGVTVASPTKHSPLNTPVNHSVRKPLSKFPCRQLSQSCVSHHTSLLFAGKLLDLHSRVPTCSTYMITCHTASGVLTPCVDIIHHLLTKDSHHVTWNPEDKGFMTS